VSIVNKKTPNRTRFGSVGSFDADHV